MSESALSVGEVAHVVATALRMHRERLQMDVRTLAKQEAQLRRALAEKPAIEPGRLLSTATMEVIAMEAVHIQEELEQVPGARARLQREIEIVATVAQQFEALIP